MAKYTVESDNLSSIANAIREKGGTTEQLEFPQGFIDAIGKISGEDDETLLWENPDSTLSFSKQQVVLNESTVNFDRLCVVFKGGTNTLPDRKAYTFVTGEETRLYILFQACLAVAQSANQYVRTMYVGTTTPNNAIFSDCYSFGTTRVVNTGLIPYQIYGVKRLSIEQISKLETERAQMLEMMSKAEMELLFGNEEAAE